MFQTKLSDKVKRLKEITLQRRKEAEADIDEAMKLMGIKENDLNDPHKIKENIKPNADGKFNLKEGAPAGSFEYMKGILDQALKDSGMFTVNDYAWIMYTYPESILVCAGEKYYEVPYSMSMKGEVTFGKKVEVEQYYVPKVTESIRVKTTGKSMASELKEANAVIEKSAKDMNLDLEFVRIVEGSYDAAKGEVEIVIIEQGKNDQKKRYYPDSTIREAAPQFAGLKMYLNHPTKTEEREIPERDITKWASTLTESWYQDGKALGKVAIHDPWLRERMGDPVFRDHVGVSINAGGKISYGKINGEENWQIVEKIVLQRQNGPASVDWVTEAGARGRVSQLLKESNGKDKKMELKDATFQDLLRENPELVKSLKESVIKDINESSDQKAKDAQLKETNAKLEEANKKLAESEKTTKLAQQKVKLDTLLKESKLPQPAKDRIAGDMGITLFESEEKLVESFKAKEKTELEYINKFSGKGKIQLAEGTGAPSATNDAVDRISGRMGLKKEEEKTK